MMMNLYLLKKKVTTPTGECSVSRSGDVYIGDRRVAQYRGHFGHMSCCVGGKRYGVARLVARGFLEGDGVVVHKNHCNWDCRAENLEWMDRSRAAIRDKKGWWELPAAPPETKDSRVRGVVCGDQEYDSVSELCLVEGISRRAFNRSVKSGEPYRGLTFGYL